MPDPYSKSVPLLWALLSEHRGLEQLALKKWTRGVEEAGLSFCRRQGISHILAIPSSLGKGTRRAFNEQIDAETVALTLTLTLTSPPHD